MCLLQGVTLAQVDATQICDFEKSASVKPTARSIARDGACLAPSTTRREYLRGSCFLLVICLARSLGIFAKGAQSTTGPFQSRKMRQGSDRSRRASVRESPSRSARG